MALDEAFQAKALALPGREEARLPGTELALQARELQVQELSAQQAQASPRKDFPPGETGHAWCPAGHAQA